jgi:hypothetical protein
MITYELWIHSWTQAFYAVRLKDSRVTGVCGPLPFVTLAERRDLAGYDYEEDRVALGEILKHPDQWGPATAWQRGRVESYRFMF